MIDALIAGRLTSKPAAKIGPSGKQFVTCRLLATAGNGEAASVSVICFAPDIAAALLALDSGDSVSLSGSLSVKTWATQAGETRAGLDLVAHGLLTPYHSGRKRKATSKATTPTRNQPAGAGLRTAELLYEDVL
jgi:hypothetical protein